jgi:hypothetical protein
MEGNSLHFSYKIRNDIQMNIIPPRLLKSSKTIQIDMNQIFDIYSYDFVLPYNEISYAVLSRYDAELFKNIEYIIFLDSTKVGLQYRICFKSSSDLAIFETRYTLAKLKI